MQRAMQSLPSSRRSPSFIGVVVSVDMNLKNFPKRLDSKTSCLRITVPENLDLALEGLIRKVLREQPKMDDIYAFAADYFDTLLKIRDKVGTKFAADQLCPFHNDEDAHEMIKLATAFAKPEILKTKAPEVEKTKNVKARKKESSKSDKAVENVKRRVAVQKKPEEKSKQTSNETKAEKPMTLQLEPKTEDIGDDEEFLKSDSIKVLVEKELMEAGKSEPKDTPQKEKPEEAAAKEELCAVVDKDNTETEDFVSNAKEEPQDSARKEQEDTTEKGENEAVEKIEMETQNEKSDKPRVETPTEAKHSTEDATGEEIKKELKNDGESKHEEVKAEIQNESSQIETGEDHITSAEGSAAEEETQKPFVSREETKHAEINQEPTKETSDAQKAAKDILFEEKVEGVGKDKSAVEAEAQETPKDEVTKEETLPEELTLNPDELCAVVDILSIKPLEKDDSKVEQVKETETEEPKCKEEENLDEVKMKTEDMPTNKEEEVIEMQHPIKAVEPTTAKEAEEENVISPHVIVPDELSDMTKLKNQKDPADAETTVKEKEEEETRSGEMKPVPIEDQPEGILDNKTKEASKMENDPVREETAGREEPNTATENEPQDLENELKLKEESAESSENKEPEKEEADKESEIKTEIKFAESSEIEEEAPKEIKTEIKAEESPENDRETNDNESTSKVEENSSVKDEQQPPEEPARHPEMEKELESENLKLKEETVSAKEVEGEMKISDEDVYGKKDDKENASEANIVEKANESAETLKNPEREASLIVQESVKPVDTSEGPETAKTKGEESTDLLETNKTPEQLAGDPGLNLMIIGDAQHVIKVEEAEKLPEENPQAEDVQIKTIQTHYYDTLQIPEQVTKEYRVHSVKNDNVVNDLLNDANVALTSAKEQVPEGVSPPVDSPKQEDEELYKRDLEDSLLTPSSNYSLNLSELSARTISEMFLDNEKHYSATDREERRYVTKTGEKCGDESHVGKREVEEIIHKTVIPSTIRATPVAPRDDVELNEEVNVESGMTDEKKQEPSVDSSERADSSNEGKSADSDTPIISVEVKTVIETQVVEDEEEEEEEEKKNGCESTEGSEPDVQIKIEAIIDVPEGVAVDVKEEKARTDEVRRVASDEPPPSETIPKDSQSSSGESESTILSTATEIKRNDSAKRHFNSTRTLITTRSLDLDNRNPLLKTRSLSSFRQGVTDFEVWSAIEKELEDAATKIQSNFRGYKTRKKLQRENAVQITTEESSCSTSPAEPESESRREHQQSTGEFHDSIVLSEHPR